MFPRRKRDVSHSAAENRNFPWRGAEINPQSAKPICGNQHICHRRDASRQCRDTLPLAEILSSFTAVINLNAAWRWGAEAHLDTNCPLKTEKQTNGNRSYENGKSSEATFGKCCFMGNGVHVGQRFISTSREYPREEPSPGYRRKSVTTGGFEVEDQSVAAQQRDSF